MTIQQTERAPSEEVVEAVARAIERADNETGYEYDHLHIECSDWGIHLARAAIAAMPSIPQESDAEVTEAKGTMNVPTYDRCDTYVAGQYVFNYLRTFLAAAGIDASRCKLVIELPDRDTQRQLVSAVQRDSKGPPRSAGRIGNHSGLWQGVEYEFSVKGWNFGGTVPNYYNNQSPAVSSSLSCSGNCKGIIGRFVTYVALDNKYEVGPSTTFGATIVRLSQ